MKKIKFLLFFIFNINLEIKNYSIVTNSLGSQFGENVIIFYLSKLLSLKYNIPFYYQPFANSDLFLFDEREPKIEKSKIQTRFYSITKKSDKELVELVDEMLKKYNFVPINNDFEVKKNYDKPTLFHTSIITKINHIDKNWVLEIKKELQFKKQPKKFKLPENIKTVAVHIRKGTGGGIYNDGILYSQQEFEYDKQSIKYEQNYNYFPFDWDTYERLNDGTINDWDKSYYFKKNERNFDLLVRHQDLIWPTRCPPNQFYIDQIIKLSEHLNECNLHVQIFTDDKEPLILMEKIKNKVNRKNITFCYEDNRNLSHKERIAQDLYNMAQCNFLIRSQSFFSRVAELMGNHQIIIFPIDYKWKDNKLIITKIAFKDLRS